MLNNSVQMKINNKLYNIKIYDDRIIHDLNELAKYQELCDIFQNSQYTEMMSMNKQMGISKEEQFNLISYWFNDKEYHEIKAKYRIILHEDDHDIYYGCIFK